MTTDALKALIDRQAITEVLYRYSRAMDRMDREEALAVFHPDAKLLYAHIPLESPQAFVDWVWGVHEQLIRHSHQNSNILIRLDGDRASARTSYLVALQATGAGLVSSVAGTTPSGR